MMYQKYLILFNILDYCYAKGANDDLPALLGEMSPNIFADSMPADMMVYEDWQVRCQNLFSWLEWKKEICDLLTHYEKEFHFCFDETKNILNELTEKEFEMLILGKEGKFMNETLSKRSCSKGRGKGVLIKTNSKDILKNCVLCLNSIFLICWFIGALYCAIDLFARQFFGFLFNWLNANGITDSIVIVFTIASFALFMLSYWFYDHL